MNKNYINDNINVGKDFYSFAVGNWLKYNPQPNDKPSWCTFDVIGEKVTQQLYDMIIENYNNYNPGMSKMNKKMAEFWYVMTNYDKRNQEDVSVLKKYIDEIHSINDINGLLKYMIAVFRSEMFFTVYITPDMKNSTHYEVEISQLLSLNNREYYVGEDKSVINKYRNVMKKLLLAGGYADEDATEMIDLFLNFETQIAEVAYDAEKLEHPELNYHMMSIDEASELLNVPLRTVLNWYMMDKTTKLNIAQIEPIKKAFEILNEISVEDLKKLVEYVIFIDNCGRTAEKYGEIAFEFTKFMTGAKERTPRWKREVDVMDGKFNEMLGQQYVQKYFSEDSKNKMIELVENLKDSFKDIIEKQSWMSKETKEIALDKLASMTYKIGYPDKWKDYSDIPVDSEISYFENCMNISYYYYYKNLEERYNKDVDKDEWLMSPHTVNAYYQPTSNEICFPAGILQGDFFNINADDACNYGGIGVVIGHEMTHGFDTCGRLFDKYGNMTDWWSEEDAEKFKELTVTTKDHFNNLYVYDGLKANGDLTLNENLADCGGLKIAYHALEKIMKNKRKKIDGFTWQQRFFISYATVWAGHMTKEIIKNLTLNNCHSIHYMRVNGTLPMFDAWYKAFNVTKDDYLFVDKASRNNLWSF